MARQVWVHESCSENVNVNATWKKTGVLRETAKWGRPRLVQEDEGDVEGTSNLNVEGQGGR